MTEKQKENQKRWREKPERIAYLKEWRKQNRPKIREYFREWSGAKPRETKTREVIHREAKPREPKKKREGRLTSEEYSGTCSVGRKYELIAKSILSGSKDAGNFKHPWDIDWNGFKIDVKMRNKSRDGRFSFYRKKKKNSEITHFLCFLVDKEIKFIFLFPKEIYGNSIHIRETTAIKKYGRYLLKVSG